MLPKDSLLEGPVDHAIELDRMLDHLQRRLHLELADFRRQLDNLL